MLVVLIIWEKEEAAEEEDKKHKMMWEKILQFPWMTQWCFTLEVFDWKVLLSILFEICGFSNDIALKKNENQFPRKLGTR